MGPLSMFEVESICEDCYYRALNQIGWNRYEHNRISFKYLAQEDFDKLASPQLNYKLTDSTRPILDKWRSKILMAADEWFVDNIERPDREEREKREREEEEARRREKQAEEDDRRRREEEERRRLAETGRKYNERLDRLKQDIDSCINRSENKVSDALQNVDIESLKALLASLEKEHDKFLVSAFDFLDTDRDDICDRLVPLGSGIIEDLRTKIEEEEARLKAEEEARLKAEAEAKRKAQDEEFRRKMAQATAQWQTTQHKAVSTPQPDGTPQPAGIACPNCGATVGNTSKFCTACGTKLLTACPGCGASVKATSKFCTQCGTPLTSN